MAISNFQALIQELGASLGVPDMRADPDGYVALDFDALTLHLQYDADDDAVVMFTRLPAVEVDRAAEIYGMLLQANLFWQGTQGATFSIDADTGRVFLADRRQRDGMDTEAFILWLEAFVNLGAHWQQRLIDANGGGPLEADDETPAQPNSGELPLAPGMRV